MKSSNFEFIENGYILKFNSVTELNFNQNHIVSKFKFPQCHKKNLSTLTGTQSFEQNDKKRNTRLPTADKY